MRYFKYLWAVVLLMVIFLIIYPKIKDPFSQIPSILKEADRPLILFIIFLQVVYYASNGWFAKILMEVAGFKLKLKDTIRIAVLGVLGNQIVPMVGGAFVTWVHYRKLRIPSSVIAFSVTTWTIFIFLNYLFFFLLSLFFIPEEALSLIPRQIITPIFFIILFLLIFTYLLLKNGGRNFILLVNFLKNVVNRISTRLFKNDLIHPEKLKNLILNFYGNLSLLLKNRSRLPQVIVATNLLYLSSILTLYFSFLVFGFKPNLATIIFGLTLATILNFLSLVPEAPGVMEASLVAVFIGLGLPSHIALSSSILFRLISYWLPMPLGILFYFRPKNALE